MRKKVVSKFLQVLTLASLFLTAQKPMPRPQMAIINLNVDVAADRKSISPEIYGLNFAKESFADEIDLPIRRWGGNATSRYNWQTNTLNSGNDWYFENSSNSNAYDWNISENYDQWIEQNERTGASSLITIPMLGYVAKNSTSCSFSVQKYGAQTNFNSDCGNGILQSNGNLVTNDPTDASQFVNEEYMQNWVNTIVDNHDTANNGGVKFYALDNEPELWSETHRDVHPIDQTYDELLDKSISYGEAIKTADPSALIIGYSSFGWSGYWYSWHDLQTAAANKYTYFPDYSTHDDMYQVEWYLNSMHQYELANDIRILDYLDLHYYPAANGVALRKAGDQNTQALRLRTTRSLWDPTYRDESWIGGNDQAEQYVKLIPRMRTWVNTYYPGTKLAITEYNFGGLEHINGALTQADVLGIFGREGLDMAMLWNYPLPNGNDTLGYDHFETLPASYAFRMYRNYNGTGGKFGDVRTRAVSADQSQLSIYAAQRSSDSALTLMIINKTSNNLNSSITISNFLSAGYAQVYEYSAMDLNNIIHKGNITVNNNLVNTTFSANSITLLIIPKLNLKSTGTNDGWILESSETSTVGGSMNSTDSTFILGDDAADRQYRSILHFDTSSLPDNAIITSAIIKLREHSVSGSSPFTVLGSLYVDMRNPSFGLSTLELGDFSTTAKKVKMGIFNPTPVSGWYSVRLTSGGMLYINRTGATQFRLYFSIDDNDDLGADFIRFFSGNATAANRPKLLIQYYVP